MKLQRVGYVAGIALTATLALTACGSDNEAPSDAVRRAPRPPSNCAAGDLDGAGLHAPRRTPWTSGSRPTRVSAPDAKINYKGTGSGAGIQAFIAGTADFAGSDSALKEDEQPQADAKCAGGQALNLPMVIGPIAVVYNVDGVDNLQLTPATLAKIFAGKITKWNDAGDRGRQPGRQAAGDRDPDRAPLGRVGHHRQLHQVPEQDRRGRLDLRQRQGVEGPGRHRRARAPTAWPARSRAPPAPSPTSSSSFAENSDLKMAKIKNGAGEFAELTGESAGKTIAGAKVEGTGNDLKMEHRLRHHRGRAPTRSSW